jgi:radical SAM protein with 4Fe4S-binding SPASM domain
VLRDCSSTELAARLHLERERLPYEGLIELTYRCNLQCAHCYVNLPMKAPEREDELTTERLARLLGEIAEAGGLFLTLSGGEALAREDFPEVYLQALQAGLIVSVFTNGTLVTERIADLFDEHRPQLVEITLYGASRETYDRVTGVPGSYDRCMAGLGRLRNRGIDFRLKTMVMAWNAHELVEMQGLADGLGVPFRFDGELNPRVDCGASRYQELQLSADDLISLEGRMPSRHDETRATMGPRREMARSSVDLYECGAGRTGYTIDARGRLLLCELSRQRGIDLHTTPFGEAWKQLASLRLGEISPESPCRECDLRPLCGSCAGANELESGDVQKPVTVFCQITHRRAAVLWGEDSGHRADASCCLPRHPVQGRTPNGLIQIGRAPRRSPPAP